MVVQTCNFTTLQAEQVQSQPSLHSEFQDSLHKETLLNKRGREKRETEEREKVKGKGEENRDRKTGDEWEEIKGGKILPVSRESSAQGTRGCLHGRSWKSTQKIKMGKSEGDSSIGSRLLSKSDDWV